MRRLIEEFKRISLPALIAMVAILTLVFNLVQVQMNYAEQQSQAKIAELNQREVVFLSDLEAQNVSVGHGALGKDRNEAGRAISLNIEGKKKTFAKGVYAHANSSIEYDLTGLSFDYFEAYFGVDAEAGNGDGVRFRVFGMRSEENIFHEMESLSSPVLKKEEAEYKKYKIKGLKRLKLVAEKRNTPYSDWAVYAGAKLYREGYQPGKSLAGLKTLEEYDAELKTTTVASELVEQKEFEILKRELVRIMGYDALQDLAEADDESKLALEWLLADVVNLRDFLTGGEILGSRAGAIKNLGKLIKKYGDDLKNTDLIAGGKRTKGELYRTMMIADAIAHAEGVCFWAGGNQCSEPMERYELYKQFYAEGKLRNEIFERLVVEEMRWVMDTKIDNKQMEWLNDHARKKNANGDLNPYAYIAYDHTFTFNYYKEKYYDLGLKDSWQSTYHFEEFGLGYGDKTKPKLWMVFADGAVCGGISKTGENLNGAFGIPAAVVGQPGHAAYLVYSNTAAYLEQGNRGGMWGLGNDISSWPGSEKGERLLLGWGPKRRLSDYAEYNVSYMLLAQANLNRFKEFEKVRKMMMLAQIYDPATEAGKRAEIAEAALRVQPIDFEVWQELIRAYGLIENKTEADYTKLADRIVDEMYKYPLPMVDLLKMIERKLPAGQMEVYKQTGLEKGARISQTASADSLQPGVTKAMANSLLGKTEKVVKFSFSGEYAGKIVLADKFKIAGTENGSGTAYEYSIDGKNNWKKVQNEWAHALTAEELAKITDENDIVVYFEGATSEQCGEGCTNANAGEQGQRTPIYTIDILRHGDAKAVVNDDENEVISKNINEMEWKKEEGAWTAFSDVKPDLSGNKNIKIRMKSKGVYLAGPEKALEFTANQDTDKRSYVSFKGMKIVAVSSEQKGRDDKEQAIDGNSETIWHTRWHGVDNERFIVVDLGRELQLSGMDYWPRQDGSPNGKVRKGKIYVSEDGSKFSEVMVVDFDSSSAPKSLNFGPSVKAKFVKFQGVKTEGGFMSVAMLNFFEDATVKKPESENKEHEGGDKNKSDDNGQNAGEGKDVERKDIEQKDEAQSGEIKRKKKETDQKDELILERKRQENEKLLQDERRDEVGCQERGDCMDKKITEKPAKKVQKNEWWKLGLVVGGGIVLVSGGMMLLGRKKRG